jgi:hypothetical protein
MMTRMHTNRQDPRTLLLSLLLALSAMLSMSRADMARADELEQMRGLVAKQAPAIVTVKVVLKLQMAAGGAGQETEFRSEMPGVVVAEDGLVMVSNASLSAKGLGGLFGGGDGGEAAGLGLKINPTDFKVVIEKEDKEYGAYMVATDATLGLAFVKLEELGDRKLTFVDFSAMPTPEVGQKLVGLARLSKGFDYAPYFKTAVVSGEINKPRKAFVLDGAIASLGLPVYSVTGDVVGVLTTLAPGTKEEASGGMEGMGMGFLMRMMGGGGGLFNTFVVPNTAVSAVIAQAKTRAVTVAAERAKNKTAQPTPPAKGTGTTKPTGKSQ